MNDGGDQNQLGVNEALNVPQNTISTQHASNEDRMDQLEHLVVQQHHELMAYLQSLFPNELRLVSS